MQYFILLLCCLALGAGQLPAATQRLRYTGELLQRDANGTGLPVHSFSIVAWVTPGPQADELVYRLDDDTRGGLAWWERCGRQTRAADGSVNGPLPRLRHVHLNRPYTLTVPGPWLDADGPLELEREWDGAWESRRLHYSVTGQPRALDRECWEVTGQSDTGRAQTLRIEKATGWLVTSTQRVFMGQGDRFELTLQLAEQTAVPEALAAQERRVAQALFALQSELGLGGEAVASQLSGEQVAAAEAALARLQADAAGTEWQRFITAVTADLATDRRRTDALAAFIGERIGKPAPQLALQRLDGQTVPPPAAGDVTVLHFWDYRGTPESPFGQVGYLDFLASQWQGRPVRVVGVAVDERAADAMLLRQVRRDVQKFSTEFMRLGYPVAIDDGTALARCGDPRPLGSPLPLWVVIGPEGHVRHLRTGLYTIDPSRGLEELKQVVEALLLPAR